MSLTQRIQRIFNASTSRTDLAVLAAKSDPTLINIAKGFQDCITVVRQEYPEKNLPEFSRRQLMEYLDKNLNVGSWKKLMTVRQSEENRRASLSIEFIDRPNLERLQTEGIAVEEECAKIKHLAVMLKEELLRTATRDEKDPRNRTATSEPVNGLLNVLEELEAKATQAKTEIALSQEVKTTTSSNQRHLEDRFG